MTFAGRFRDKVMVVTGAAQGIGKAIALGFAESGADLLICDLEQEMLEEAAREATAHGHRVVAIDRVTAPLMALADDPALDLVEADLETGAWPLAGRRFFRN